MALADSEVEHASQVTRIALRPGPQLQLFRQPGLADAGLAADHDGRSGARISDAVEHALELAQLGLPADQREALAHAVPQRRNAVHLHRVVEALDAFSPRSSASTRFDTLRYTGCDTNVSPGRRERVQPGGEIHRVAGYRVLGRGAAREYGGHHFAAGDADVQLERVRGRVV